MDIEGGHVGLQEDDDCHCETLPNGEKICDPWQCDKGNVTPVWYWNSPVYLPGVMTCNIRIHYVRIVL